jgi:RNA polymerase sigma factor (sigma-70 family)
MPSPESESGEALFLAELPLIERVIAFVCARHHVWHEEAEDFASYVKLKFIENSYAVLDKFEARSTLKTYLTTVVHRMFLDYRDASWGKWRPSAEAKRAGPVGVLLERLLVRDGRPFDEACELLRSKHGVSVPRAELERVSGRFPVRPRRRPEPTGALADPELLVPSGDDIAADVARGEVAEVVSSVLKAVMGTLDPESQLILVLRFEDGRKVAEIASLLRLDPQMLYRRVQRLLRTLRQALEDAGVTAADSMDMLEKPDVSVDWATGVRKSRVKRPSDTKGRPEWR